MLLTGVVVDTASMGGSDAKAMLWLASSKSLVSAFSCGEINPIRWTTEAVQRRVCKGGCVKGGCAKVVCSRLGL